MDIYWILELWFFLALYLKWGWRSKMWAFTHKQYWKGAICISFK